MYKKLLCTGVAVLSISSASFASGSMYTAQAPVATPASSDTSDSYFYLGLQGGMASSGWKARDGQIIDAEVNPFTPPAYLSTVSLTANKTNGAAGRIFAGYSFNKYLAAEFGYLYAGKTSTIGADLTTIDFDNKTIDVLHADLGKVRTQAFDLVGKVKAPIADTGLGVYAKLGAGYLMMKGQDNFSVYKSNKVDLVYGAGVSYDFNENWAMDVSWTRYNSGNTKVANLDAWQPNVDFYALGVTYKFAGV